MDNLTPDIYHASMNKYKQIVAGDTVITHKCLETSEVVVVVSDGLGSGIKANVLSGITSAMAVKFAASGMDIKNIVETIMQTLPVCSVRKVSYATFSIMSIDTSSNVSVMEYGTPHFILCGRNGVIKKLEQIEIPVETPFLGKTYVVHTQFTATYGDKLVVVTDGVTQAGMGTEMLPKGWGDENLEIFVEKAVTKESNISAKILAKKIVEKAKALDDYKPKDDITCVVCDFRETRKLLLVTGAPINKQDDSVLAQKAQEFSGTKVISGGTTAKIIARMLNLQVKIDDAFDDKTTDVPPKSEMEGFKMVTEGVVTLGKVRDMLKEDIYGENVAGELAHAIMEHDEIEFLVGKSVNASNYESGKSELRVNLVEDISEILRKKYFKKVVVHFL